LSSITPNGEAMPLLLIGIGTAIAITIATVIMLFIAAFGLWLYIGRLYDEGRRPGK